MIAEKTGTGCQANGFEEHTMHWVTRPGDVLNEGSVDDYAWIATDHDGYCTTCGEFFTVADGDTATLRALEPKINMKEYI